MSRQSKVYLIGGVTGMLLWLSASLPHYQEPYATAQIGNEPVRAIFFRSAMEKIAGLAFGHSVDLKLSESAAPLKVMVIAARFCGSTNTHTGKIRFVLGPDVASPTWKPIDFANCSETTRELAVTLTGTDASPDWVAVFDTEVKWVPWKFTTSLVSDSISFRAAPQRDAPAADYFRTGIPKLASREISTETVEIGIDSSNRAHVAVAGTFQNDALVLTMSPNRAHINTNDLLDPTATALINSAPELSNFIGRFPIATVNGILAAQPNQTVSIPQGNNNPVQLSNLQLSGGANTLHIRGNYHSRLFDAAVDCSWVGSDLALVKITIDPVLENCVAGDGNCIARNAVKNGAAGVAANAYTATNLNKKLRPGEQERHDVQIGDVRLTLDTTIARSSTDGNFLNFFGSARLTK